jgi:hypothetical protein
MEVIMFRKVAYPSLLIVVLLTATTGTSWARQCSPETVKGKWVAFEQGTVVIPGVPPIPVVLVANVTFDGAGNLSGTYRASVGGFTSVENGTFTGTYTVSADCSYSDFFTPAPQLFGTGPLHHTGFITGEGILQEAHYIYSDGGGSATSGTAKRQ